MVPKESGNLVTLNKEEEDVTMDPRINKNDWDVQVCNAEALKFVQSKPPMKAVKISKAQIESKPATTTAEVDEEVNEDDDE